jgi:hypothetical protein
MMTSLVDELVRGYTALGVVVFLVDLYGRVFDSCTGFFITKHSKLSYEDSFDI